MQEDAIQSAEAGFGERVREIRLQRGLTQRGVGEEIGVDASAISRLEQGTRAVRLGEAALIAKVLNADLEYLVYGDLDPVSELRRARAEADEQMHEMRMAALEMSTAFLDVVDVLNAHPDLFGSLDESIPKHDLPSTEDEYFDWVLRRIHLVFRLPDDDRRLVVLDQHRAQNLMALVEAAVKGVVSSVPFPETEVRASSGLGRGLASLIPADQPRRRDDDPGA